MHNLSWRTTYRDLKDAFAKFGEIEECIVFTDHRTKKSLGRGIVRFATEESMNKALQEMNKTVCIMDSL